VCNSWVPGIVYVELNSKRRHTNSCSARTHVAQERAHTTASVRACVCDLLIDLISFLRASKHHYAEASEQWNSDMEVLTGSCAFQCARLLLIAS
jgi:hypothetical protein